MAEPPYCITQGLSLWGEVAPKVTERASMLTGERKHSLMNYLLTLAYDGTNYCGFQVQPNGRSVAAVFQDALEEVLGCRPDIKGCSRTDAGVHALGFMLNFHADTRIPAAKLPLALNQHLPPDIRALDARVVPTISTPGMQPIPKPTSTASTTTPSTRL